MPLSATVAEILNRLPVPHVFKRRSRGGHSCNGAPVFVGSIHIPFCLDRSVAGFQSALIRTPVRVSLIEVPVSDSA